VPGRRSATNRPAVGLDLAGSPHRDTGFCRLGPGLRTATRILGDDAEILDAVRDARPSIVAIDAPLSPGAVVRSTYRARRTCGRATAPSSSSGSGSSP